MKLERTSYTAIYNRGNFYQGDFIRGFSVKIEEDLEFGEFRSIVPVEVQAYIKLDNSFIELSTSIREDGYVIIGAVASEITEDLLPGRYNYKVIYHLPNNSRRTYVAGYFRILGN